jgi:hypothetical protein
MQQIQGRADETIPASSVPEIESLVMFVEDVNGPGCSHLHILVCGKGYCGAKAKPVVAAMRSGKPLKLNAIY